MGNLRKIGGVGLAVAVVAALAVYVLIPKTGPAANSVVVNEPQNPTNGGPGGSTSGGTATGGGTSGGSSTGGGGTTPSPSTPPSGRPPKAHGQNSHGPKHLICRPTKDHPGTGVSQYQGATQYRGQCPAGAAFGAAGHGHHASSTADVTAAPTLFYAVLPDGVYGIE